MAICRVKNQNVKFVVCDALQCSLCAGARCAAEVSDDGGVGCVYWSRRCVGDSSSVTPSINDNDLNAITTLARILSNEWPIRFYVGVLVCHAVIGVVLDLNTDRTNRSSIEHTRGINAINDDVIGVR